MQTVDRRRLVQGAVSQAAALVDRAEPEKPRAGNNESCFVTAGDGTRLFVQDWGHGRPIVFLSAWTSHSNVWGSYVAALSAHGFRCIVPDRRGQGRSDAPKGGYDLNTLTSDLATVVETLDLHDLVLVAHSMGSVEAGR